MERKVHSLKYLKRLNDSKKVNRKQPCTAVKFTFTENEIQF